MGQNVQNVMKCDERLWRSELDRGVRFCIKKEDRKAETVWSWSPLDLDQLLTSRKKRERKNRKNNQFWNENWDNRTEKSRNRQRGVAPQPKWDTRSRNLFEWILWVLPSPGGTGSCCQKRLTKPLRFFVCRLSFHRLLFCWLFHYFFHLVRARNF